ncbi:hypothetical protein BK011_08225 [Tenericutes bacterium MZ-XQ]|nr:hypothetical protein BK011_08225 [Tenericutes bacterium MZ-XQ]
MKQRKLVIGLLVMLAVAVSGFTFAFWAGAVSDATASADETITIGSGQDVTTTVTLGEGAGNANNINNILVPAGRISDSTPAGQGETLVTQVVYTYNVDWDEAGTAADGFEGTLSVVESNVFIDGAVVSWDDNGTPNNYVNVAISLASTSISVNGGSVEVTVTVTIDEPVDANDYDLVANGVITFNLTFSVDSSLSA